MGTTTGRLTSGFLVLAVVWIAVYWLWEPKRSPAPISFATPENSAAGTEGGVHRSGPTPSDVLEKIRDPLASEPGEGPDRARPDQAPPREQDPVPAPPKATPAAEKPAKPDPRPSETEPQRPGVVPPEFREHTLVEGDTFPSLARKYFGSEKHASAIARANPLMDPRRLRPGRVVRIPIDPQNIQGKPVGPATAPPAPRVTEYVVQSGDTLSGIAEELLGDSSRAEEIYQLNRDVMSSPDNLRLGVKLKIPAREGTGN